MESKRSKPKPGQARILSAGATGGTNPKPLFTAEDCVQIVLSTGKGSTSYIALADANAKVAPLQAGLERLREENAEFRKQRGIACLTHDLCGYIACGRCLEKAEADNEKLRARVAELEGTLRRCTTTQGLDEAEREIIRLREALEFYAKGTPRECDGGVTARAALDTEKPFESQAELDDLLNAAKGEKK